MSKLGIKCKAYYNSATYGSPTWVEVNSINDLTATIGAETATAAARADRVNVMMKTAFNLSWSGTLRNDGSTDAAKLIAAALTDEVLDMLILDGPVGTAGSEGIRCDCQITQADEDQSRGAVLYRNITIMPTYSANPIQAIKIAGDPAAITAATITGSTLSYS